MIIYFRHSNILKYFGNISKTEFLLRNFLTLSKSLFDECENNFGDYRNENTHLIVLKFSRNIIKTGI